jgi:SAM-dependent methyltransferase
MNIFDWIKKEFEPVACSSAEFIYDKMESQSDYCLPLIYKPFDINNRTHWRDRGWAFDFFYSTSAAAARGTLLDFGPGDGWPSLIVAPYVDKVIGLDVSPRRVEVCTANAKRIGIANAEFVHYQPGQKFPFEDNSFDGVMAASSVEETENPKEILSEFFRVLRPGGRFRISYDGLSQYKGGREHDLWIQPLENNRCFFILSNRQIEDESFEMYGLTIDMSEEKIKEYFAENNQPLKFKNISIEKIKEIRSSIIESKLCSIPHPSGKTFCRYLEEIGFENILPSIDGAFAAGMTFDSTPESRRPQNIDGVDRLIRPLVEIAVNTEAPIEYDPAITAVKPNV